MASTEFRKRLHDLRRQSGWSQSELARRVWGTIVDSRGYTVAKNRDRISAYESGRAIPAADNLEELAKALNVSIDELFPGFRQKSSTAPSPTVAVEFLASGSARVRIDTVVDQATATKILSILSLPPP